MTEYDGDARPLPYELRHPLVMNSTTEEDGDCEPPSFVWPEDSDERVVILFKLSLNEYNVLASAIDAGSDIAYGVDAIRVNWLWLRNMRCQVSLCAEMINVLDTCEEFRDALNGFIGNAIGNVSTVQQQLRDFITGDGYLNDYFNNLIAQGAISPESQNRNMLKPAACDSGYLYNQAFAAEDVLKNLAVNVFSAVSVGANAYEWATLTLTIMPIVGGILPAIAITAFAAYFVETYYTEYAIQWTAHKDAIICLLWCRIEEDCDLSLNDLIQFHIEQSGLSLPEFPLDAFKAIVEIITGGTLTGVNVVHGMHLLLLTAMRLNQTMLGIDFGAYAISITAGGDTSDDGYLDCDPCGTSGLWAIQPGYAGLSEAQSGMITSQTSTSVTFSTDEISGGEYRIIAQYNSYGDPVTIVTSSDPGSILAKYHGVGSSLFGGTYENSQLEASDELNYLYFTHTAPFTLSLTFTT